MTAALQGVHPVSLDFVADPAELAVAVVQGEVLVEAAQHHREVLLLLASLPMSVSKPASPTIRDSPVCTENLKPEVVVMESAEDGERF